MELQNLDFNLIRTLDAVLREGSVTKAADQLQVSQPAVSAALGRLRRHFGDELLQRVGNRYVLTPLAIVLRERCAVAIRDVERVFDTKPDFDASTEQRQFTIMASDYAMAVVSESLGPVLQSTAPHVRLMFTSLSQDIVGAPAERIRGLDGLVLPHGFFADIPHINVWTDEYVCLVAASNERVGPELTMELLAELPWVFTYVTPAKTASEQHLQAQGISPRVETVVESFLALPFAIAGTNRIAMVQSRLAPRLTASGEMRALRCPFNVVPIREAFWWHPMYDADPAHVWLRQTLVEHMGPSGR